MTVKFEDLVGKTLLAIEGAFVGSEKITFVTAKKQRRYSMYHNQSCCENVSVDDIVGDVMSLLDTPIVSAYETTQDGGSTGWESSTWTFYNISTVKGSVTIKWLGRSNGYYSERVDFVWED